MTNEQTLLTNIRDAEQMLLHAVSFQNAYTVLNEHCFLSAGSSVPEKQQKYLLHTDVVSISFSTEIGLKATYKIIGSKIRLKGKERHNLKALFHGLPTEIQNAIFEQLARTAPGHLEPRALGDNINSIAEAFTKWRYSYEHHRLSFPSGFCLEFSKCITDIGFHLLRQKTELLSPEAKLLPPNRYPARLLTFTLDSSIKERKPDYAGIWGFSGIRRLSSNSSS